MATKAVLRRKHTADFKAKVALEALQERSTLSEISERHGIHPNLVSQWKKNVEKRSQVCSLFLHKILIVG